jgi:hypothetical protein
MSNRGRLAVLGRWVGGIGLAMVAFGAFAQEPREVTDIALWKMIIRDSIAAYPRSCPCPYSADRLGQPCGDRSAYARAPSSPTFCYPQDIPEEQIARYREKFQ